MHYIKEKPLKMYVSRKTKQNKRMLESCNDGLIIKKATKIQYLTLPGKSIG